MSPTVAGMMNLPVRWKKAWISASANESNAPHFIMLIAWPEAN